MDRCVGSVKGLRLRLEPGGWAAIARDEPSLQTSAPEALLERAAGFRGNLRFVREDRRVRLLGELRYPLDDTEGQLRCRRLRELLAPREAAEAIAAAQLEAMLAGSGRAVVHREGVWVVPATAECRHELRVRLDAGAIRVEAALARWEELGETARAAIAELLSRIQAGMRFARAELTSQAAWMVSRIEPSEFAEDELRDALGAVAAACRLLARETAALVHGEVAAAYLEHLARGQG